PPFAESMLGFLLLFPIVNPHLPSIFFEINYLTLLALIFFKFRSFFKADRAWWYSLICLYILICSVNHLILSSGFWIRSTSAFLDVLLIYFTFKTGKIIRKNAIQRNLIWIFLFLYYVIIAIAIISNIVGETNISRLSSMTAILGVVHIL